ncbi:hypothetical protein KSS87_009432 [Heliosperma pusillum]|nr:hypothetical protein KSS87_009432 [Heliosperma pusillum]
MTTKFQFQMSGGHKTDDFVKVAVLADPQLMDRTSIGLPPKSFVLETIEFYTDLYMRRAFVSSVMPFKPDVILFLGDYFDGGPFLSNQEWQESLSRFEHIFDVGESKRSKDIPVYYLTGNHDIGYAWHANHKPEVIERYESRFGRRNYKFTIREVDFVAIDAQVIDGTLNDDSTSRTWEFVNNVTAATYLPPPDSIYAGPGEPQGKLARGDARKTRRS